MYGVSIRLLPKPVKTLLSQLDIGIIFFVMQPRKLRILQSDALEVLGICEACNMQFSCSAPDLAQAALEIKAQFDMHSCRVSEGAETAPASIRMLNSWDDRFRLRRSSGPV